MPNLATYTKELLDPEVLTPIVENNYQKQMVFMPLAEIDRTLEGRPGSTVTVPTWGHLGDAVALEEGQAIPTEGLGQGYTTATVSKFGKGSSFTDEADITSIGNVVTKSVSEITTVLAQSFFNII